eukprot:g13984.t1
MWRRVMLLLSKIVCHYLKTWFLPDFIVTVIDIVLEFSGGEEASTDRASTRVLRLLRLLRVVRLGKLTRFASFLRDKFESEVAYTQFSLLLLIIGMMLQEHVIACGWFGIGSFSSEENTWLTVSKNEYSSFTLPAVGHKGEKGNDVECLVTYLPRRGAVGDSGRLTPARCLRQWRLEQLLSQDFFDQSCRVKLAPKVTGQRSEARRRKAEEEQKKAEEIARMTRLTLLATSALTEKNEEDVLTSSAISKHVVKDRIMTQEQKRKQEDETIKAAEIEREKDPEEPGQLNAPSMVKLPQYLT